MGIKEKLEKKKQELLEQMQRGRERTEQAKAEKLRRKQKRFKEMKPGARQAMVEGLIMHKKPWDVAKDEYNRRKYEREKKYGKD